LTIELKTDDYLEPGQEFRIPNTMLAFWRGDLGVAGKVPVRWSTEKANLTALGFKVDEEEWQTAQPVLDYLETMTDTKKLHGVILWSHGREKNCEGLWNTQVQFRVSLFRLTERNLLRQVGTRPPGFGMPSRDKYYEFWKGTQTKSCLPPSHQMERR